jgi:hypothetical protein
MRCSSVLAFLPRRQVKLLEVSGEGECAQSFLSH